MKLATLQNKYFFVAETFLILVLPLLVLYLYPSLYVFRQIFLLFSLIYIFLVSKSAKFSYRDLGLSKPLKNTWLPTLGLSLFISAFLVAIAQFSYPTVYLQEIAENNLSFPRWAPLVFYVIVSVPLQEFIFRGFYIQRLKLVSPNRWFPILASALVFGAGHLPFTNRIMPVGTFFLGLWWAILFIKSKSLWPVILSHAIIGFTLVALTLYH